MKKYIVNILLLLIPVLGPFIIIVKTLINIFKIFSSLAIATTKKILLFVLTYLIIAIPLLPALGIFMYAIRSAQVPDYGTVMMIAGIIGFFLSGVLAIISDEIVRRKSIKY